MKKDKSWVRLAQYFAGELSSEESKKMKSWIIADPYREEKVERLFEIWEKSKSLPYELDVDKAWMNLSDGMDEIEKQKMEEESQLPGIDSVNNRFYRKNDKEINRPGVVWRRLALVAATVLIVALAGFFSFYTEKQANLAATDHIVNQVFETKNGERATYVLSDGSKVILHAGSRLEISGDYNRERRELFLEGEAYFETAHNPDKPFIVRSQIAYTRVLGTRFLVQAWPENSNKVEVIVSEGKVALGSSQNSSPSEKKDEIFITKNKMGIFSSGQAPVITEVTDMNWYLGWTEGHLKFKNRPLREILPRLERWYNIEIEVENENIHNKKITAEIDYSQSMSEVLQGIALTLDLELEKENQTVRFFKKTVK